MSKYRIEFRPAALEALRSIDATDQARIHGAIALLGEDPRPPNTKALRGRPGLWVRVAGYRVMYAINDGVVLVAAITAGHRSDGATAIETVRRAQRLKAFIELRELDEELEAFEIPDGATRQPST